MPIILLLPCILRCSDRITIAPEMQIRREFHLGCSQKWTLPSNSDDTVCGLGGTGKLVGPWGFDGGTQASQHRQTRRQRPKLLRSPWRWMGGIAKAFGLDAATPLNNSCRPKLKKMGRCQEVWRCPPVHTRLCTKRIRPIRGPLRRTLYPAGRRGFGAGRRCPSEALRAGNRASRHRCMATPR